jgi:tRNA-dihydrouridine synthase B
MPFSWSTTPRPIVALAPMAGVTDAAYRQFIKSLCPEAVVYTEFLSTDAIHYGAKKTMGMLHFDAAVERPFIVQVFGQSPEHFISAAKVIEQLGADGIDINMGCPAAKVVSSCHGAALLKNVDLAARLVDATKKAVSIPVSVKTRLGWNTTDGLIRFCTRLVEAGADALAIHGRRYCDKFTGAANWDPIYELKNALPHVPIIGNGDIATPADAVAKIGNLDGVMIGRGTFGNPWLLQDVMRDMKEMKNGKLKMENTGGHRTVDALSFGEKIPFILRHCELSVRLKGERRGMVEMRRHLNGYVKGFPGAAELRMQLMQTERLDETERLLLSV